MEFKNAFKNADTMPTNVLGINEKVDEVKKKS